MDVQVESMQAVREVVQQFSELGGLKVETDRGDVVFPFAYTFVFLFFDGLAVIQYEVCFHDLRNVSCRDFVKYTGLK